MIAAITSCHQHLEPGRAFSPRACSQESGRARLTVKQHVKTSLAPGSRVVTEYLKRAGLTPYLEETRLQPRRLRLHHLHRQLRAPQGPPSTKRSPNDLVCAAVLSGNRNFEARPMRALRRELPRLSTSVVTLCLAGTVLKT